MYISQHEYKGKDKQEDLQRNKWSIMFYFMVAIIRVQEENSPNPQPHCTVLTQETLKQNMPEDGMETSCIFQKE
jgi:hypothetical protein